LDAGFVTIVDKIEEHDKNLNFRDVNAQEKMQVRYFNYNHNQNKFEKINNYRK